GPLSEPVAGTRLRTRELVLLPQTRRQADLVLPGRSRSLVKIGRMLEAVESGQIVIDPECRLLLGDNPGEPSMRAMCLLRVGIHRRHAIVIPVVLEMSGVAGQQKLAGLVEVDQKRLMARRMPRRGKERRAPVTEHIEVTGQQLH